MTHLALPSTRKHISLMRPIKVILLLLMVACLSLSHIHAQSNAKKAPSTTAGVSSQVEKETTRGLVLTESLASAVLRETRTGVDPNRSIKVYLPPSYSRSNSSFPVVYYC